MASFDGTFAREMANGSELNIMDSEIESVSGGVSFALSSVKDFIIKSITTLLKGCLSLVKGIVPLVSHLVSSLLSMITSVITVATCEMSTWLKVFHMGTLTSSITSMLLGIGEFASRIGFSWCPEAAGAEAKKVANTLYEQFESKANEVRSNALAEFAWAKLGVCSVVTVLFAGLGLSKLVDWKDLIMGSNVVEAIRKTTRNVSEVADFIIKEIIGMEDDSDYLACKNLEELAEEGSALMRLPPAHYLQHSEDLYRLMRFPSKLVQYTSAKMSNEASKRYTTVKQLLVTIHRTLEDKWKSIDAIIQTKPRQATIGLLLSGPPGHGKSEFGKYIAKQVCDALGYKGDVYCLNKRHDGFFEPYGGSAIGVFNEWMALRDEDPILKDLNLICSTDPINFEGAALENKVQPCQLKICFLTSNIDQPELTRTLNEGAAMAVWDRLYHIRVFDPKCRGRHHPNTHRKPDFSHLTFEEIQHPSNAEIKTKKTTYADIFSRLVGKCADAEKRFISGLLEDPDTLAAADAQTFSDRMPRLREILRRNSPYDVPYVFEDVARSNGFARNFFTIRLQGPPGSGKTTIAENTAAELSEIFHLPIQFSSEQSEMVPDPNKPLIYIMDDWCESCDYAKYVTQINRTHPRSIFILCSNTVFVKRRGWGLNDITNQAINWAMGNKNISPWDATQFKFHHGFLRRSGLQGYVKIPNLDEPIQIPESLNRTYTCDQNYVCRDAYGVITTPAELLQIQFALYRDFLQQPHGFTLIEGIPPEIDPNSIDFELTASTVEAVISTFKSKVAMMRAWNGTHPDVQVKLSAAITGPGSPSQTMLSSWGVSEPVTDDPEVLKSIFSRMCGIFQKCFPGRAMLIKITEGDQVYYFRNNTGYFFTSADINDSWRFSVEGYDVVYTKSPDCSYRLSIDEILMARLYNQYTGGMRDLTIMEVKLLNQWVDSATVSIPYNAQFYTRYAIRKQQLLSRPSPVALKIEAELRKHPIFWISAAVLFFVATSASFVVIIRKLLSGDKIPAGNFGIHETEPTIYSDKCERCDPKDQGCCRAHPESSCTHFNGTKPDYDVSATPARKFFKRVSPIANGTKPDYDQGASVGRKVLKHIKPIRNAISEKHLEDAKPALSSIRELCGDDECDVGGEIHLELARYYAGYENVDTDKLLSIFVGNLEDGHKPIHALCNAMALAQTQDTKQSHVLELVKSNMLRASDMIPQQEARLQQFRDSIRKYYVGVEANDGRCYGVALKGNLILSVSHMFKELGDEATIINDGQRYDAYCCYLDRGRDLSVVRVIDKRFPNLADTRRHFHAFADIDQATYGYFMRCGPDTEIYGGGISYYHTSRYPVKDKTDQNFTLSEQLIVYTAAGCHRVRDFVGLGDCGFPLVSVSKNAEIKIVGIHCAYNFSEKAYFSCFSREDHSKFVTLASNYVQNANDIDHSMSQISFYEDEEAPQFLLPTAYAQLIERVQPDIRFSHYHEHLNIVGYSRDLSIRSRPKSAHTLVEVDGGQVPLTTLPAAFTHQYVEDESALAYDSTGRTDPLFTQCLKYDKRVITCFDPEIFESAVDLVSQDMEIRYGGCRWLRLYNVLNGIPNQPLAPLDPSTSAGPLLKITYGIHHKAPLFKLVGDSARRTLVFASQPASEMVRFHYETYLDALKSGGPPPLIISKDCAKVELIDADKAKVGKVRLFNEVDISINLVLKHFFGDLCDKIMTQHEESPIRMGQDPLRCAQHIWHQFNQIDGNIVSTDFSAFDKQLPSDLIYAFCRCVAKCYKDERAEIAVDDIYCSLAYSLTYVLHTCRGTLYMVDRGNESGTFVTTMLNSVSVQILTYYTIIRKWRNIMWFTPSLSEIYSQTRMAILGDDRTFKATPILDIRESDFMSDSCLFGLKCTQAKTQGMIDFCSRSFYPDFHNQLVWPALKISSVYSQIKWFKSLTISQIKDNLDNVLFEAALHADPAVFDLALHDAKLIIRHFNMPIDSITFYDRFLVRKRFIAYIRGGDELDALSQHIKRELRDDSLYDTVVRYQKAFAEKISKSEKLDIPLQEKSSKTIERRLKTIFSDQSLLMTDPKQNPISALLERLREVDPSIVPHEAYTMRSPTDHHFRVEVLGRAGEGTGPSKRSAKRDAYALLYDNIIEELNERRTANSDLISASRSAGEKIAKTYMYESVKIHLCMAAKVSQTLAEPVTVLARCPLSGATQFIDGIRYIRADCGENYLPSRTAEEMPYKWMSLVYAAQPGTTDLGIKIIVGADDTRSNSDRTAGGTAPPAGVAANPGLTTIPHLANPVNESVAPAMHQNPGGIAASIEMTDEEILNTDGPGNMLGKGGIQFDIKDLIYNQFLDCDTMFSFTDDTGDGKLIFQIPYSPLSKFVNKYIQKYSQDHERYTGDLLFRLTLVGNQTFSGLVSYGWAPYKLKGDTIPISELQKYAYSSATVNEMWNKVFRLKDARQTLFWRKVAGETEDDIDGRPHLLFVVLLNAQSPLRQGISVRIRIASKLAENFQFANPVITAAPTSVDTRAYGAYSVSPARLIGSPLIPAVIRPLFNPDLEIRLMLDGNTWLPKYDQMVANDQNYGNWVLQYISALGNTQKDITTGISVRGPASWYGLYRPQGLTPTNGNMLFYIDTSRAPAFESEYDRQQAASSLGITIATKYARDDFASIKDNMLPRVLADSLYKNRGKAEIIAVRTFLIPTTDFGQLTIIRDDGSRQDLKITNVLIEECLTTYGPVFTMGVWVDKEIQEHDRNDINKIYNPNHVDLFPWMSEISQISKIIVSDIESMPLKWRRLVVTADPAYARNEAARFASELDHPTLKPMLRYVAPKMTPTECLQITIADIESGRDIIFARYFADRDDMAVYAEDSNLYYGISARPAARMYISQIGIVERSNDFPPTAIDDVFLDNQIVSANNSVFRM